MVITSEMKVINIVEMQEWFVVNGKHYRRVNYAYIILA